MKDDEAPLVDDPAADEALAAEMKAHERWHRTTMLAFLAIALAGVVLALLSRRMGWVG